MTPDQEIRLCGAVERIEAKLDAAKETTDRHERAVSDLFVTSASHREDFVGFRSRIRGGMAVVGAMFTLLLALVGLGG